MTTYFVTRYSSAIFWAAASGIKAEDMSIVQNLDVSEIKSGDTVIGTLPVSLAAAVCAKGARYRHLSLDLPPNARGRELSPEEMRAHRARIEEYEVKKIGEYVDIPIAPMPLDGEVHVCLVSEQQIPNIIPCLIRRPAKVYLIRSEDPEFRKYGDRLKDVLCKRGFSESAVEFVDDAPSTDYQMLIPFAQGTAELLPKLHPGSRIVMNATGGTKPMALAFVDAFKGIGEVIYVDTKNDHIEYFSPLDRKPDRLPSDMLDINTYLEAQGYAILRCKSDEEVWRDVAEKRKGLSQYLAENSEQLGRFIGMLNALAANAGPVKDREPAFQPEQTFNTKPVGKRAEAIREIAAAGLLEWNRERQIKFCSEEASAYLKGGWLEEYAWNVARTLGATDVKVGVDIKMKPYTVKRGEEPLRDNELDLVVLHRNKILLAECKTANLEGKPGEAQNVLNKLNMLSRYARGLFGKSLFVSARQLEGVPKERAANYRIDVLETRELSRLRNFIEAWMSEAAAPPVR